PNRRWTSGVRRVPTNRRSSNQRLQRGGGKPASPFVLMRCSLMEPDMLQDIPPPTFHEASLNVLETERLTLRRPTPPDVKTIAPLANDRRIAENTRRLPHPYSQDHAVDFVRTTASERRDTAFLIESNYTPIGMAGIEWSNPAAPELGYWVGVE